MRHIKNTQLSREGDSGDIIFPIRLNKLLGRLGAGSRRTIDELIKSKRILVNNNPVELGYQAKRDDSITLDGAPIFLKKPKNVYILLNKPKGFVTSASDELGRKTVLDLINIKERIYPIGRLDKDTTGVLILTNDGDLTYKLSHPKFGVTKQYVARLSTPISQKDISDLSKGIVLDDYKLAPCKISIIDNDNKVLSIELHEGRYRQIRRMFETRGYEVVDLDRISYADLTVDGVPMGKWRHLTYSEIASLQSL